jgi:hypothetical protein
MVDRFYQAARLSEVASPNLHILQFANQHSFAIMVKKLFILYYSILPFINNP